MRTISAAAAVLLQPGVGRRVFRVKVRDSGGTFRDLSTYPGSNFVVSGSWKEDVDSNGLSADITLRRAVGDISLAPLHATSPLNRAWVPTNAFAALLALGRELQLEWALVPGDEAPAGGDWQLGFFGVIDALDWADEAVTVACRGLEARLMDAYAERERVYAYAQGASATKGVYVYEVGRLYLVGDLVIPSQAKQQGHFYQVTTGGTAAVEPTWPVGSGATVTSGAVFTEAGTTSDTAGTPVETVIQQLLNDNVATTPTLYVPTSPSWSIKLYQQQRQSAWDAIRALVQQIGWDIRYQFDNGTGAWRLTLIKPDRAKAVDDYVLDAGSVRSVGTCAISLESIRNIVQVIYSDSADRDTDGNPRRKVAEAGDATSITAYGRRWMELAESSSSNIDTYAEAVAMAQAAVADLSLPTLDYSPSVDLFPHVQLGDLLGFVADGLHFTADQHLAVVGYEHSFDERSDSTKLTVRGKPAGGSDRWIQHDGRLPGRDRDIHRMTLHNSSVVTLAAYAVIGGMALKLTERGVKAGHAQGYEVHVGGSAGFTPDAGSLKASGDLKHVTLTDLEAGLTYYAKVVPFGRNGSRLVRGEPSEAVAFTPDFVRARHLHPSLDLTARPLNGGFELIRPSTGIPENWTVVKGDVNVDWATNASAARSGSLGLEYLNTANNTELQSALVPVQGGLDYGWEWWVKKVGAPEAGLYLTGTVTWLTSALASISTSALSTNLNAMSTAWELQRLAATAPSTACWARINFLKSTATNARCYVDDVACRGPFDPWQALSYGANWSNYGGSYLTAGCSRDAAGRVSLRGLVVRTGTASAGETMATLPAGYRPSAIARFIVETNAGTATILVGTSGALSWYGGGNAFVVLDQIAFDTR